MAGNQLQMLSVEIDRILTSPYPVCLKHLHDIVVHCNEAALRDWAESRFGQVDALTSTLLESLDLWSYTLDLLCAFSNVFAIRDCVLSRSPCLLEQLLITANASSPGFRHLSRLCTVLLSEPLPIHVPVPASAETFFNRLAEIAIESPSVETIEPVYRILDGACGSLLDVFSPTALHKLQERFIRIIRTVKNMVQPLLFLLCLAILGLIHKRISSSTAGPSSGCNLSSSISLQDRKEISAFFAGHEALKMMTIITLQVISACASDNPANDFAVQRVTLCRRVAEAVDLQAREQWVQSNAAVNHIQKLHQRVAAIGVDAALRIEAHGFTCMLPNAGRFTDAMVSSYHNSLLSMAKTQFSHRQLHETLSVSLPQVSPLFTDSQWVEILEGTFSELSEARKHHTSASDFKATRIQLDQLKVAAINSLPIRQGILRALASTNLVPSLESFLEYQEQIGGRQSEGLNKVGTTLSSFLISITLCNESTDASLPLPLALRLVEVQSRLTSKPVETVRPKRQEPPKISIFEQASSQETKNLGNHWREGLAAELSRQAKTTYNSTVGLLSRACEDLEKRCESVEEPLRAEQAKSQQLQNKYNDLQNRAQRLEKESQDRAIEVSSLQEKNARAAKEAFAASSEAQEYLRRIEDLEHQLQQNEETTSRELLEAQQEHEKRELGLRSSIACHIEKMDNQDEQINRLKQEQEDAAKESMANQQKAQDREGSCAKSLAHAEDALRQERENTAQLQEDRKLLGAEKSEYEQRIKRLQNDMAESQSRHIELINETEQLVRNHELKLEEAQNQHKQVALEADRQATTHRTELEKMIENLQDQLTRLHQDYTQITKLKDEEIRELQRKNQKLSKACRQKDAEVEEANGLRSRMLGTLGIPGNRLDIANVTAQHAKGRSRDSSRDALQAFAKDTMQEDEQFDEDAESEHEHQSSFGSATSSSKSGPTPKRPKPRQSAPFRVPSMQAPDLPRVEPASKPTRAGRQSHGQIPLQERSSNRIITAGTARKARGAQDRHSSYEGSTWAKGAANLDDFPDISFGDLRTQDLDGSTVEL